MTVPGTSNEISAFSVSA